MLKSRFGIWLGRSLWMSFVLLLTLPVHADTTNAQRNAAEAYLAAVASGDARAMAHAIHESQLELLRKELLENMRLEADRNENVVRGRLFGVGMPLADIERLTVQNFFVTLAGRLRFGARPFDRVEWLEAVPDDGSMVHLIGRSRPLKEQGNVRVAVLVSLVPWGKDWKAALPLELQAQIDDLRQGRTRAPAGPTPSVTVAATGATPAPAAKEETPGSPAVILELFTAAESNLKAGRCEEYYGRQMSPNFKRTTAAKAFRALVNNCSSRSEIRDRLIAVFEIARSVNPRLEYAGTRAVYDLRGKGLQFSQLVLEQVDKRWYVAE